MLDMSYCKYCIDKIITAGGGQTVYICKKDDQKRAIDFLDECPKEKKKKEGKVV